MDKKYEFFEHTADTLFRAYGKNIEEAFSNSALALTSVVYDIDKIEAKQNKSIEIVGVDLKSALVHFLSEFVYLMDGEGFILSKISSITINKTKEGYRVAAVAKGDKVSAKYKSHGDVKAVTYNSMEIKEEKGKAYVQVVLDI